MPEGRPIVVTADDLGLRADWDSATFAAFDDGYVHAVSWVTNGPRFDYNIPELRERPELEVGVHLNLLGNPPRPVGLVLTKAMFGGISRQDVVKEWTAQVQRAVSTGIPIRFLNGHYHLHMLPDFFDAALEVARKFHIRYVRLTDEPPWLTLRMSQATLGRAVKMAALNTLAELARGRLVRAAFPMPPTCRGLGAAELLGEREWLRILREPGTTPMEIVCHPWQSEALKEALASERLQAEIEARPRFSFGA